MNNENPREIKQELSIIIKIYVYIMMAYSVVVVIHNILIGLNNPHLSIQFIGILLRVTLNLIDIIALVWILRKKFIGVWIYISTGFFSVLFSMAFPMLISPLIKYINIIMKIGLLLFLNFKRNNLSGYQTLGMTKIDGKYIDELLTGRKRYQ